MKVIIKKPFEKPKVIEIENKLSTLQEAVGGPIEVLPIAEDICVLCNGEGEHLGLPHNIVLCGDVLVGTILIVGVAGEGFCDLSDFWIMTLTGDNDD